MARTRSVPLRCEPLEAREVPALIFAVNQAGKLLTFDTSAPSVYLGAAVITGLNNAAGGERITDIDVRPGSGELYGRSNFGQLYRVSTFAGFSVAVGTPVGTFAPNTGMDFDPVADRLRVVSNGGENYTFNPTFGNLEAVGAPLSYLPGDAFQGQAPRVTGIAFTNSVPLATSTTLYGIDHVRNTLVTFVSAPNSGLIRTVGSLGFDVKGGVGFDIDGPTNVAFAALQTPNVGPSLLSTVNLATGAASVLGVIGPNQRPVLDIALARGGSIFGGSPFATGTGGTALAPGVSAPFFSDPFVSPIGVPTAPLFPSLSQPLAAGTFGTPVGSTFGTPIGSTFGIPIGTTFGTIGPTPTTTLPIGLTDPVFQPSLDPFTLSPNQTLPIGTDPFTVVSTR
jgi:hypothetical protein